MIILIILKFNKFFSNLYILAILFSLLISKSVLADEDGDDEDDFAEEIGESLGYFSVLATGFSFVYIILRQKVIRNKLKEKGISVKKYGEILLSSLNWHMLLSILAFVFAVSHTWFMVQDNSLFEFDSITGVIPLILMLYLSISGLLLWNKLPNNIVDRSARRNIRLVHIQKWVTILFVVSLLVHVS